MVEVLRVPSEPFRILSGIFLQSFHRGMLLEEDYRLPGTWTRRFRISTEPNPVLDTPKRLLILATRSAGSPPAPHNGLWSLPNTNAA